MIRLRGNNVDPPRNAFTYMDFDVPATRRRAVM